MALTAKAQEILEAPAERRNELIEANIDKLSLSDIGEMSEIIISQLKPIMEDGVVEAPEKPSKATIGRIGPKLNRTGREEVEDDGSVSDQGFEDVETDDDDYEYEELDYEEIAEEDDDEVAPKRRLKRQSTLSIFASGLPFPGGAALGAVTGAALRDQYGLPLSIIAGSTVLFMVCLLSGLVFRTVARDNVRWATATCCLTSLAYVLPLIPGVSLDWGGIADSYGYLAYPAASCLALFLALRK